REIARACSPVPTSRRERSGSFERTPLAQGWPSTRHIDAGSVAPGMARGRWLRAGGRSDWRCEMAGSVHQAKFDRLFDIFDVTGDGYVSQEDFDSAVNRVVSAEHGSLNGSRVQAVREAGGRFWTGLREHADADEAGRISREAFRAALDAA